MNCVSIAEQGRQLEVITELFLKILAKVVCYQFKCWETSLGQEVYRLIMTDLLLAVLGMTLAETVRSQLKKKVWPSLTAPGFDISRNTLNLIHNQTLFWVGFFFSPLLPLVMVVKMFLTFYIKKFGVLNNCEPSARSWRATQTETLFLVFTFVALLGVLVTYGYIITRVNTSDCGPFQGSTYMYEKILEDAFQVEEGNEFWHFLMFLTKPGVVAGVLLTMCAGVYYLRAQSSAQMKMVEILREMLHAEARDKEYLLEKLSFFTGGRKSQIRNSHLSGNHSDTQ
ncbi:Transmembrane channel-like protein 5 [Homalodisca vitripennis]|nr:Transmembrane channel-like protein 5 [Homalodisca vitripennis]